MTTEKFDSSKISLTANITSYAWEELNIENAGYFVNPQFRKIFKLIRFLGGPLFFNKKNDYTYLMLEPRHKAIEHFILTKFPHRQIVEFASGLSPRGMTFAADPEITYIEADLPKMLNIKKKRIQEIYRDKGVTRENHKFVEVDLLHDDITEKISPLLDRNKPLTIITEGLTPYFDMEHLKIIFSKISALLKANAGGVYITDIYHVEDMKKNALHNKVVRTFLGLLQAEYRLDIDNVTEGESFFRECGFDFVETINPLDFAKQIGINGNIRPENGIVSIYIAHVF